MAGRITSDYKGQTIKLRLNDSMREFIKRKADRKMISMSEYIRQMIADCMKQEGKNGKR